MADNIDVKDATETTVTVGTVDLTSVHLPKHVMVDSAGNFLSGDYMLDIASGAIAGSAVINKFGANDSSTADTDLEVWDSGTAYSYPATALMTSISQTTDQVALRGGTICVSGLDASWNLTTQNATLDATNTTTVVTLTNPLIRVHRMCVLEDVVSTSSIRVHNAGETIDYAIINTGQNQTLMALYTIPNGKTAYVTNYYGDVINATAKTPTSTGFKLWAADRDNGYEFQMKHAKAVSSGGSGTGHQFKPYFKITQKTDIKITAYCEAEAGHVHAGFDLILIDN